MAVKGLKYKRQWEVWGKHEAQLQNGEDWIFYIKKPHEGLILLGGELGPIDTSIILGDDNFVREKLKKKAEKIRGYLRSLASVINQEAKASRRPLGFSSAQKYSAPVGPGFLEGA